MKESDKYAFDEIFRSGLSAPDLNEVDEDWELLKSLLQNLEDRPSFTNSNIYARGLSSFHTGYQNNYVLGIANLNFRYKGNLNNNVKPACNPYLKLPFTVLGYSNTRLRSAGMSVETITNLNKNIK